MDKYFYSNSEVNDENVTSIKRGIDFTNKINNIRLPSIGELAEEGQFQTAVLNTEPKKKIKPLLPCMDLELSDIEVIDYLEGNIHDVMMLRTIIKNLSYYSQNITAVENRLRKSKNKLKPIVRETLVRYGYPEFE